MGEGNVFTDVCLSTEGWVGNSGPMSFPRGGYPFWGWISLTPGPFLGVSLLPGPFGRGLGRISKGWVVTQAPPTSDIQPQPPHVRSASEQYALYWNVIFFYVDHLNLIRTTSKTTSLLGSPITNTHVFTFRVEFVTTVVAM